MTRQQARGLRVQVRVRPGAPGVRVGGSHDGALLVAVTARAVDGAATRACLRAVAEAFGVRPRQVHLHSGERSRTKLLDVEGSAGVLRARLEALLADE